MTWWPEALAGSYGIAAAIESGPAEAVSQMSYKGQLYDMTASARVRARLPLGQRFVGTLDAGASLHLVRIEGSYPPHRDDNLSTIRFARPSLGLGLGVQMPLRWLTRLSLAAGISATIRWQDYQVDDTTLLSGPGLDIGAGIGLVLSI